MSGTQKPQHLNHLRPNNQPNLPLVPKLCLMPKLNRNRLHAVFTILLATAGAAYALRTIPGDYQWFKEHYEYDTYRIYVEQKFGKSYNDWYAERVKSCSDSMPKNLDYAHDGFARDEINQLMNGCVDGKTIEEIELMRRGEMSAFVKQGAARFLEYFAVIVFGAWLVGYLLAKGIPFILESLWSWLQSTPPKQ
jgi:hypothetical protein